MKTKLLGIFVFVSAFLLFSGMANATTSSDLSGWAWSPNVGWLSFNSTNDGAGTGPAYTVKISTTTITVGGVQKVVGLFSGYAWSPNVGWVSFNAGDVVGCPSDASYDVGNVTALNGCAPTIDMTPASGTAGAVTGWAKVLSMGSNDGWLQLSGTNHKTNMNDGSGGITYSFNPTNNMGELKGFAYEPSALGWFKFDLKCAGCATGGNSVSNMSVSCNTPQTSSASNPLPTGNGVNFYTDISGGTGPYTYAWNGCTSTSGACSLPSGYSSSGTYSTSVTITDSSSPTPISRVAQCPNIYVSSTIPTPDIILKAYKSNTGNDNGNMVALKVQKGKPVYVTWVNSVSVDGYDCKLLNTPPTNSSWDPDPWKNMLVNSEGVFTPYDGEDNGPFQINQNNNQMGLGTYAFSISCKLKDITGFGIFNKFISTILSVVNAQSEQTVNSNTIKVNVVNQSVQEK